MKDTTKTIIIGSIITVLVLVLTIFIIYKIDSKKIDKNNSNNRNENNSSTLETNTNNNSSNTTNNNENNEITNINNPTIKDDEKNEKVIIYLFHGATCPACNNALKTIKEERNTTFKNVEIITYEIWNNKDNNMLLQKVSEKLNVEAKYIPYFVIGKYSKDGFNKEILLEEYKNALNNKNYQDMVQEVIKENSNLNTKYETI